MKKILSIAIVVLGLSMTGCGSDRKDSSDSNSTVDTSMQASPGLDTNGVGTDTLSTDTNNMDTSKTNNPTSGRN